MPSFTITPLPLIKVTNVFIQPENGEQIKQSKIAATNAVLQQHMVAELSNSMFGNFGTVRAANSRRVPIDPSTVVNLCDPLNYPAFVRYHAPRTSIKWLQRNMIAEEKMPRDSRFNTAKMASARKGRINGKQIKTEETESKTTDSGD